MEAYYYSRLDKQEKMIYQEMYIGIRELKEMFLVLERPIKRLSEIFFFVRLDHPDIFWAVSFRCRSYLASEYVQVYPEYLFEKSKVLEQKKALEARIEKLVRPAMEMDEAKKEKYIHDFIVKYVKYDKLKKPYSHEIIGPLGHGVGVCEGIAKTVKVLCERLGINCVIAVSEANPEKKINYRHAWNIITINKTSYHLDATFDNTISGEEIRYDYYNLSDRQIFKDHEPLIEPAPECSDGNHFYYLEKKLSFTKKEDLENRIRQAVKKNRSFVFHWRGGYLTKEAMEQMLSMIHGLYAEKGQHCKITLNLAQAVVMLNPVLRQEEEAVTIDATYDI